VIRYKLEKAGVKVIFLGALTPAEEFVATARETAADCVFVSSLYGMGSFDCADLRAKFVEAGIGDILLYIGGVLCTDPRDWENTLRTFKDLGFNRVYPPGTKVEEALDDLLQDLAERGRQWAPVS
jgi:methylaspartate mutase S subunit